MKILPRELWAVILEWKTNLERKERFIKALYSLEKLFKRPKLILIMADDTEDQNVMTYFFKAGSMVCIDYTTVDKGMGFTINTMTTYSIGYEEGSPTNVWLSSTWSQ